MTALTALPIVGSAAAATKRSSSTLVAYFSRSGNTRVIAGLIQRATNADMFEIRRASPYPEEYLATVAEATRERDENIEPALAESLGSLAGYDTIYLGFPIWGETAPPVIRSFLSRHELSGKTLIPFVTHGGFGLGNSHAVLRKHAASAKFVDGFSMEADQERRTMNTVLAWLKDAR